MLPEWLVGEGILLLRPELRTSADQGQESRKDEDSVHIQR